MEQVLARLASPIHASLLPSLPKAPESASTNSPASTEHKPRKDGDSFAPVTHIIASNSLLRRFPGDSEDFTPAAARKATLRAILGPSAAAPRGSFSLRRRVEHDKGSCSCLPSLFGRWGRRGYQAGVAGGRAEPSGGPPAAVGHGNGPQTDSVGTLGGIALPTSTEIQACSGSPGQVVTFNTEAVVNASNDKGCVSEAGTEQSDCSNEASGRILSCALDGTSCTQDMEGMHLGWGCETGAESAAAALARENDSCSRNQASPQHICRNDVCEVSRAKVSVLNQAQAAATGAEEEHIIPAFKAILEANAPPRHFEATAAFGNPSTAENLDLQLSKSGMPDLRCNPCSCAKGAPADDTQESLLAVLLENNEKVNFFLAMNFSSMLLYCPPLSI